MKNKSSVSSRGVHVPIVVIIALVGVVMLGFWLRTYRLSQGSPSLYADEVGGNYKYWVQFQAPGNMVAKIPLAITSYTWILGLTPLAARLPSAIYGSLTIVALFLLALALSKDISVALFTAILGAVVPWLFMLSRVGFAWIPLMVILVCMHGVLYCHAKEMKGYVLSLVPLLIGAYLYPSLILISVFVLAVVCYEAYKSSTKREKRRIVGAALGLTALIALVLFGKYHGLSPISRGIDLAIWRDVNVTADSNFYRGLSRLSESTVFSFGKPTETLGNKIVYNYPGSVLGVFFKNYLSFFSPDFLFLKGDTTLRQSTGMTGSFFLVLLPFMLYGVYLTARSSNTKIRNLIVLWILVSPIPGAITKDGSGYLLRVVTMMPFLTYLSAFGIVRILENLNTWLRLVGGVVIGLAVIYSAYSFLFGYFHVYPALAAKNYEYGFKELSGFQFSRGSVPMLVVWDGDYPDLYFRFWQRTPAEEYLAFKPNDISFGESVFHQTFPNLYFSLPRMQKDLSGFLGEQKIPYWAVSADFLTKNPEYRQSEKTVAQVIKYPDQTDDFVIYKSF